MMVQPYLDTDAEVHPPIAELKGRLRGQVILPGDASYDVARHVWNGMIDRKPAIILCPTGVADVIEAITYARRNKLAVAVRGGGHNVSGSAVCDGGVVIDLSAMRGIRVDPVGRTARAEGGVTWGELDRETQVFGLATPGGLISSTGIAGLTLGGGIGWLARKYGLSCDNLLSVDIVTADGKLVQASPRQNRDLFWAIRGGGGNFGVVTSFEYRLHPVGPSVFGGIVIHPMERAGEVLRFYRAFISRAPDELSAFPAFINIPPLPDIPSELHGKRAIALATCYAGTAGEAERALAPLRAFGPPLLDLIGALPYCGLQSLFDASAPHGALSYWKSDTLDELSDDCIDVLLSHTAELPRLSPLTIIHIYPLRGAIGRVRSSRTAFRHRSARFSTIISATWLDPADSRSHIDWVRGLWQAMRPCSSGGVQPNFLGEEGDDRVRAAYGKNYPRLVAVKRRYDPTNFFHMNQNIHP
jgi:FAD binding domain/Berberine and berberine like